jgi:hypothetical protein
MVPELCTGFRCRLPNGTNIAVEDPEVRIALIQSNLTYDLISGIA